MDPFTAALRALIGKKVYESAKTAYNDAKTNIESMISNWDASLKADYAKKQGSTKTANNKKTVSDTFDANGTINTDPLAGKKNTTTTATTKTSTGGSNNKGGDDAYTTVVKMAQDNGYTPTDAEVDTILQNIKNRNIIKQETTPAEVEDSNEVIEYTYKPGDTFGQVLLNLGLSDGSHLWGSGGDVEFYTEQLKAQDMLDQNGNVKLGIPFKLRRRK